MTRTRREAIFGAGGLAVLAVGALGYEGWNRWRKRYPPSPYDDLLSTLPDREQAKRLGRAFLATHPGFSPAYAARALRGRIGGRPLASVLQMEIGAGRLIDTGHWLLPESLAGLCALAAKT